MSASHIDFEALRRLSVPERLQLVADLWDSIAHDAPDEAFPITPELAAELDRRWAEHQRNPDAAIPWEQVERELFDRHSRPE